MGKTKVSVIIATYNTGQYIQECLDSIFNQTLHEIEVIVIDDGSTDDTKKVINDRYYSKENLVYVFQDNTGAGIARNRAITMAHGEYLMFMDPDDKYPREDSVERLYRAAMFHGVDVCGGNIIEWDGYKEKNRYIAGMGDERNSKNRLINSKDYYYLFGHTRYIYRTSFVKNNNIVFLGTKRFEDQVFVIKALEKATIFFELDYPVYWYRASEKKTYTRDTWLEIFIGYRETIDMLISSGMRLMFKKNISDLLSRMVGKYRQGDYLNDSEFKKIAVDIDKILTKCEWTKERLRDYFALANELDNSIKCISPKKKIILYGAGKNTENFLVCYGDLLKEQILGVAVTNMADNRLFLLREIEVRKINDYVRYKNDVLVIITPAVSMRKDIEGTLKKLGFDDYQWIDMRLLA